MAIIRADRLRTSFPAQAVIANNSCKENEYASIHTKWKISRLSSIYNSSTSGFARTVVKSILLDIIDTIKCARYQIDTPGDTVLDICVQTKPVQ